MNLKNCPFCGCVAHIVPVKLNGAQHIEGFQVYCSGCMLRLPQHFYTEVFTSQEEATKAWNCRDEKEYRDLIISFIISLCYCDHMGDVSNDMIDVLKKLGIKIEWDSFDDLAYKLHKQFGVNDILGTDLWDKEDE